MARYEIHNAQSGHCFGVYEGETREEALDALARDAGYKSHADACKQTGTSPSSLVAYKLSDGK